MVRTFASKYLIQEVFLAKLVGFQPTTYKLKMWLQKHPHPSKGYSASWWKDSALRKMVLEEYLKYSFYLIRYQWTSGPLQKLLAKFDKFKYIDHREIGFISSGVYNFAKGKMLENHISRNNQL